jgi:hypothetical protein
MVLVLRPRSVWEGADLGIRLVQSRLSSVFPPYLCVALPLFLLCCTTAGLSPWLPALLIWMSKPWLDRTILFALSRALFNESTAFSDVWTARRDVWWSQLVTTLTLRRLSASRAFTQPILQLEGLAGAERVARVRQLAPRYRGAARMMTLAFAVADLALFASALSLQVWLAPRNGSFEWLAFLRNPTGHQVLMTTVSYAAAVCFVEPFYVAAGFGMYLNRRVALEAWDIEQEFRRAFAA